MPLSPIAPGFHGARVLLFLEHRDPDAQAPLNLIHKVYDCVRFRGGAMFVESEDVPQEHKDKPAAEKHFTAEWLLADWFREYNGIMDRPALWQDINIIVAPGSGR